VAGVQRPQAPAMRCQRAIASAASMGFAEHLASKRPAPSRSPAPRSMGWHPASPLGPLGRQGSQHRLGLGAGPAAAPAAPDRDAESPPHPPRSPAPHGGWPPAPADGDGPVKRRPAAARRWGSAGQEQWQRMTPPREQPRPQPATTSAPCAGPARPCAACHSGWRSTGRSTGRR
jgi:hypothetical protein